VQVERRYLLMTRWLLIMVAALSLVVPCHKSRCTPIAPALAAEAQPFMAQAPAGPSAGSEKSTGGTSLTPGMGKEAVRTVWGDPEEVRKIRTCFGWQEEWVYRGDAKRFGASERILLFDEGEVLTEIK
jgi:hypothetical protein